MAGKTKAKKSGDPRKVDRNNMDSMSIDDYLNDIAYVYKTWDGKRSVIDHWLHLLRHASKLAEVVRRQEAGSVVKELGEVFIWMLSFVKELKEPKVKEDGIYYIRDLSITDVLWRKYPAICPVCFDRMVYVKLDKLYDAKTSEDKVNGIYEKITEWPYDKKLFKDWLFQLPCNCMSDANVEKRNELITADPEIRNRLNKARVKYANELDKKLKENDGQIKSISNFQSMFTNIYFAKIRNAESVESIAFHLLEEIGEISKALVDLFTYNSIKDELPPNKNEKDKRILELRCDRIAKLEEEIADVFSWIFSLTLKVKENFIIYNYFIQESFGVKTTFAVPEQISMPNIVFKRHGDTSGLFCPQCKKAPCTGEDECSWVFIKNIQNGLITYR